MPCDSPYIVSLDSPHTRTFKGKKVAIYNSDDLVYSVGVPCGRCGACRKNKVDEWSFRLRQEQKDSRTSHFVTLTYSPEHCPVSNNGFMTLERKHVTNYLKRLRSWMWRDGLRLPSLKYYCVGEYGETNERPHYHMIMLNGSVDHIVESWCTASRGVARGDGVPLGHVHIGNVTTDSIAYCVKYLDKRQMIPKHSRDDRVKEFSRMSQHLGIGYLTPEMVKWHKADLSRNYIQDGPYKIALPRYYRDKIFTRGERRRQLDEILDARDKYEVDSRREYFADYPHGTEADYFVNEEFKKEFRFNKYYKNGKIKKRDL